MLETLKFILHLDILPWILSVAGIIICLLLYKAQKIADSFDLRDLIVDDITGKVSLSKLGQLTALGLSSWGFLYMILNNQLTEMYFNGYMLTWAGANALNKGISIWGKVKTVDKPDTP